MNQAEQVTLHGVIAELRHLYAQVHAGNIKNHKRLADGLLAPQIEKLERLVR